jgi:hypothetical protein
MVSVQPSNTTGEPLFVPAQSLFRLIESQDTAKNHEEFSCRSCLRHTCTAVEYQTLSKKILWNVASLSH